MRIAEEPSLRRRLSGLLLALLGALSLFVWTASVARAAEVKIFDRAGVLNIGRVEEAAKKLEYPIKIYTMKSFRGSSDSFVRAAEKEITAKNQIVLALNTGTKDIALAYGKDVKLSGNQVKEAVDALENTYERKGNYTEAVLAALEKLPQQSGGGWLVPVLILGVLVIGGIALFLFLKRRQNEAQPHEATGFTPMHQPEAPNYDYYRQPVYDEAPQQGGMNPLVAGGIGAVAGGLVGYALGSQQAQHEAENQEDLVGGSVYEDIDAEDESFGSSGFDSDDEGF
uniref:TPM domain-containing protein n=1 Tax=Thermosporothrix sp. COM3 TaxID=2490863 RepID=A0A455SCT3_9CHLR|nr:hypothetical protein KTC_03170 [Thermosporothrix sp. COM3]